MSKVCALLAAARSTASIDAHSVGMPGWRKVLTKTLQDLNQLARAQLRVKQLTGIEGIDETSRAAESMREVQRKMSSLTSDANSDKAQ